MTDEEADNKYPHAAPMLRRLLLHAVGQDGFIAPLSITADQIDDILCSNFELPRGPVPPRRSNHTPDDCHGGCGDGGSYSNSKLHWTVDYEANK